MKNTWEARTSPGGIVLATWSQVERLISRSDMVLHVLDIREPLHTFSNRLVRLVEKHDKKILLVLNKCDLVPSNIREEWKNYFERNGYPSVYISATLRRGTIKLRRRIRQITKTTPLVISIVGYPKVGKSSIINALKGRHSATTSPYPGSPGYTRTFQLYRVSKDMLVIDSPGILPVEGDPLVKIIRGYPPEKLQDPVKAVTMLIERILRYNPDAFRVIYDTQSNDPLKILEELAIRRGWFYKKTREPLIEEAARCVIRDYHNGRIVYYTSPGKYNA
ncbi:MAG: GTPase [Desulfurococcaceae archaeon]